MSSFLEGLGFPRRVRNGAVYYELLKVPSTTHLATAIINSTQKYVYPQSQFSIDYIANSWKYGQELQFKSYSHKPPVLEARVDKDHAYYRLECGYLAVNLETAEKLEEIARIIRLVTGTTHRDVKPLEKVVDFI